MTGTAVPFEMLVGAWVATGLTLFILTFLYEDNPLFKLAEHLYVGISVGYTIVKSYDLFRRLVEEPLAQKPWTAEQWLLLVPLLIGSLMLARYVPRIAWLSRIAFAFVVGVGSGLAIPRIVSSYILKQVEDTVRPLISSVNGSVTFVLDPTMPLSNLNAIVVLIGVVSVLFYFFFSVEHTGPVRVAAQTGIVFLMIAFGAAFGYTVMARMSLLIGRFSDLIEFAAPRYGRPSLWLLGITILTLVLWSARRRTEP